MKFVTYNLDEGDPLPKHYESLLESHERAGKYREAVGEALMYAEEFLCYSSDMELVFGFADPERVNKRWVLRLIRRGRINHGIRDIYLGDREERP